MHYTTKTIRPHLLPLFAAAITGLMVTFGLSSCKEDNLNKVRDEAMYVFLSSGSTDIEEDAVSEFSVDVRGGETVIYVSANVGFTPKWEDATTSPWTKITGAAPEGNLVKITLESKPLSLTSAYYTRRSGTLILASDDPELNFNTYIKVHQGSVARISNNFSWLRYGKEDPRIETGETPISGWNATQKNYNYSSTVIAGEDFAHLYGRNGYIKLGDSKGHGADIITPPTAAFASDSLLMCSFNAVAFTDYRTGDKDGNKLRVEVIGGGVISDFLEDGKTSIEFEVPYYDLTDETFPANMWKNASFLVFVESTPSNPISASTQIRIIAGSLSSASATNNRIFLDNIYVRRLYEDVDQPYFKQNGGSGPDRLLAPQLEY